MSDNTEQDVIFGEEDEKTEDEEDLDAFTDNVMDEDSQEENNNTEAENSGSSDREEIEERVSWKLETLGACSGENRSIMRRYRDGQGKVVEDWVYFDPELSKVSKDRMQERISSLQENKDQWGGPIKLKMVNKGTMDEPEVRFIDYKIPDEVPEDFEAVSREDDNGSEQDSGSSNSEDIALSDYKFDEAMKKLEAYSDGHYSVKTEVKQTEPKHIVKASVKIEDTDESKGAGVYTGHGTDEDSTMNNQLLEVSETRAIKRAIKNSGALFYELDN